MYEFVTNSVTNLWIWWCVSYVWVCHTLIRTTHMIICMISRILCMISWLIHAHFMTHPYTQKDMSFLHEFVTHFICMSSWLIHIRNEAYHSCQANVYESVTFISMISWLIHAHKTTCRTAHAYTLVTYSCRQKEMTSTLWVTNSSKRNVKKKCQAHYESRVDTRTGWWRTIGCLKLQVSFRKSATNYRALLQKMIYKDAAFYGSSPPCKSFMPSKRNVRHTKSHELIKKKWKKKCQARYDRKPPHPQGEFPIYYVLWSKTGRKRTPHEEPPPKLINFGGSSGGVLYLPVLDQGT